MKVLKTLIEHAHDTMDEVWEYAKEALSLRASGDVELAETYHKIAKMHVDIYGHLHQRMVAMIEEQKKKGVAVPEAMMAIWEYEHGKLIAEFAEAKVLIDEFSKSY